MIKKERVIILLGAGLIFLSACTADPSTIGFGRETPTPEPTPTALPTPVPVFQTTISADGQIVLPLPPQIFSFQSTGVTGTIAEVFVRPGDRINTGQPLVSIDDTDLRNTLIRAEASLVSLEAQIASETAPPLTRDIIEAEGNVTTAQLELNQLLNQPSEDAITQAAADLRLREIELRQAQEAYDVVAYADGIGLSPQAAELQQATINYERALAAFNEASKPPDDSQIAAARLKVVQAENQLTKLKSGPTAETEALNEARLNESRLQVEEAQGNLVKALLFAPWNGEVIEVNAAPGVATGNASITIAQVDPLRFATSNFSERNLADIKVGDEATLFLKSHPNIPFPAVVQRIELESTRKDGDTALFTVYFDFNSAMFEVRPGMTGRIEISIEPER